MLTHDHPILAVNRNLHRLPLILDILDEIEEGTSHPGDEDLRHGSHQAVRKMVERLQGIEPSHAGTIATPPAHEVQIASTWLLGERPRKLLPPTLYEELASLIGSLIADAAGALSGQTE